MSEKLRSAVEELLQQLKEQQEELAETKRMINALCKRLGDQPMFEDVATERVTLGPIRPDLYYGKGLATAAQEYLTRRGQAASAEEIIRALMEGGFDFSRWKEKDRLRSFTISLSKNSKTFHRLPNGTFGLPSWYPDVSRPPRPERREEEPEREGPIPEDVSGDDQTAESR